MATAFIIVSSVPIRKGYSSRSNSTFVMRSYPVPLHKLVIERNENLPNSTAGFPSRGPARTSCFCLFYLDCQVSFVSWKLLCWGKSWDGGHEILSPGPCITELRGSSAVNKALVGALILRAGIEPTRN